MTTITQRFRVVVALMLGVVIFGTMAWVCYATYPWPSINTPWHLSFSSMRQWRSALDAYKREHTGGFASLAFWAWYYR